MPSKIRLRKIFEPLVKLTAKLLITINVTPNIATLLMLISSILSVIFLVLMDNLLLFGIFVFITGILDGVDGAIARLTERATPTGGFLDSTLDRISEMILFMGLLLADSKYYIFDLTFIQLILGFSLLFSYMISYTRARADVFSKQLGEKWDLDVGIFARSERLFYLFISSILGATVSYDLFSWALVLFCFATFGTFVYRVLNYRKNMI